MPHRAHEVAAPNVIGTLPSQPNARPIVQPQPSTGRCFCGTFNPRRQLRCTRSFHLPTITLQQRRNSPVSVATVLTGQGDDRFGQRIFVDPLDRGIALCSSPLPQQLVSMALIHFVFFARMLHRTTPLLRA